jgi:hypothetical protein
MNAGLTVAKLPKIEINSAATSAGSLRGHACPFIESIVIKFPDIEMYVDKKYATDSCEFRETRAHEDKHYKGFAATLRTYQTDLRERLRALYLPMQTRPIFASNIEAATGKIDNAISAEIHQIIDSLREQLKQETTLLDRESSAVHARCTNW